ncbi:MAG: fumarylacetoacetate hydrolase family protein [candidate division NC10 bacterium]|nr:fumarylacetoacetate hydrolase family protein [candidate division NC10 bacterium]
MHLVTFARGGVPRLGALEAGAVLDLNALTGGIPADMLGLIRAGTAGLAAGRAAVAAGRRRLEAGEGAALERAGQAFPAAAVRLLAPIPRPAKNIFCVGRNYVAHAAERGAEPPGHPVFFTKPPTAVIGPEAEIVADGLTRELDFEVELAVVIGREGKDIPPERVFDHIFGYTILNDVTARDLQKTHQQWFKGKSLDTSCPLGPAIVTAEAFPDPQAVDIRMRVNGEVRQASNTRKMIFDIPTLVSVLSRGMTLEPGDLIATGTPEGVGAADGRYLKVGDVLEAEVEGIGVLRNRVARV